MYQLVMHHVPKLGIGTFERHHYPVFVKLGNSAHPFFQVAEHHIRLLPIVMGFVNDDDHSLGEFVIKVAFELAVSFLSHFGHKFRGLLPSRIEIDIKMLALNIIPVEIFILNFIFSEILGKTQLCQNEYNNNSKTPLHYASNTE